MKKHFLVLLLLLLALLGRAVDGEAYDYPLANPHEATVVGSPSPYAATLPETIRAKTYELYVLRDEIIDELDMDDSEEGQLKAGVSLLNAIDTRHQQEFRYYETGSPFEYDLIRMLYLQKRELQIGD